MDFDFVSRRAYLQPLDPEFVGHVAARDVRDILVAQSLRSRGRMERALRSHGAGGGDTARRCATWFNACEAPGPASLRASCAFRSMPSAQRTRTHGTSSRPLSIATPTSASSLCCALETRFGFCPARICRALYMHGMGESGHGLIQLARRALPIRWKR